MEEQPRVMALIPAYNEEKTIGGVVRKTMDHVDEVVVVDDGSSDDTRLVAEDAGARVIQLVFNLGIGGAQMTGYRYAVRNSYDIIAQLDSDGQHDPSYIPDMVMKIEEGCDMVIGSRFLNASHKKYSPVRVAGIRFFSVVARYLGGTHIKDITSGYRVYRVEALKRLSELPAKSWAVEQTLEAMKRGLTLREVSVPMPVRRTGQSQFNLKKFIRYPFYVVERITRVLIWR